MTNLGTFDVVVCGGGTAGAVAAISAARNGAKTLLVERGPYLGGVGVTGFFPHSFYANTGKKAVGGIAQEIVDRLVEMDGCLGHLRYDGHLYTHTPVDSELKKVLVMQMVEEAGVTLCLDSMISGVETDKGRVTGIVLHNKGGSFLAQGKVFVDSTGDGDIAAWAGAPFEKGRGDGKTQPVSLNMRVTNVDTVRLAEKVPSEKPVLWVDRPLSGRRTPVYFVGKLDQWDDTPEAQALFTDKGHQLFCLCTRENDIVVNTSRLIGVDGTDMTQTTKAAVKLRQQIYGIYRFLKKYVPGFENSFLVGGDYIGVRETRRFKGDYLLTAADILEGKMFPDNIGLACYPLDMHDPDGGNVTFTQVGGDGSYGIPYRCLLPQGIDNVILAGRSVSATHEALASVRSIAACEVMGHGAGAAAAMAAAGDGSLRGVDISALQQRLGEQNAILQ